MIQKSHFEYLSKINENMISKRWFTRAKIWKQPKCPSMDEWIKKMWYTHINTYNGIFFTHEKEGSLAISAICMSLEDIILNEVSGRERQLLYDTTSICNLKSRIHGNGLKWWWLPEDWGCVQRGVLGKEYRCLAKEE